LHEEKVDVAVLIMRFVIGFGIGAMIGGSWVLFWDVPMFAGVTAAFVVAGLSVWYGDNFLLFVMRYIRWIAALAALFFVAKLIMK